MILSKESTISGWFWTWWAPFLPMGLVNNKRGSAPLILKARAEKLTS